MVKLKVMFKGGKCVVASEYKNDILKFFQAFEMKNSKGYFFAKVPATAGTAFVLLNLIKSGQASVSCDEETFNEIKFRAKTSKKPRAELSEDGKKIIINIPGNVYYASLLKKIGAWPSGGDYTVHHISVNKFVNIVGLNAVIEEEGFLPVIEICEELDRLRTEEIPGFDGKLSSLKNIPLDVLHTLSADSQTRKDRSKSSKSLVEKLNDKDVRNLYDLLFYLPKRYIDKTDPQTLDSFVEGETVTVIGSISSISLNMTGSATVVTIVDSENNYVRCYFWGNRQWMRTKFKDGDVVCIIGKAKKLGKYFVVSASSIDHSSEIAALPVLPVYKQSPSSGLTTVVILAAIYELLGRLSSAELPDYFPTKFDFASVLRGIHFPENMEHYQESVRKFAYIELVYLQVLVQRAKRERVTSEGVPMVLPKGVRDLQSVAIERLPFTLTKSQKGAVEFFNKQLESTDATTSLLNAEVGSGKTVVVQLACLRAVSCGKQAVLVAPTEILAQQLMSTFKTIVNSVNKGKKAEDRVTIEFLSGSLKAKERREIMKRIESGETDIIVGTHSVLSKNVKYKDLGVVCVDEQQKFGAAQRSVLLDSRDDGLIPDLIMSTATPIPRTISQLFYGDIESFMLTDRPPGRKPVEIQWVQEDPSESLDTLMSPMWTDIQKEIDKGNKVFVIAPLVNESSTIDAASVEAVAKKLRNGRKLNAKVGVVTGKMKKEQQNEVMSKFRSGEYNVLVASIVVEVGVDVPEATRVVILSADRLGASSIWQIKGRVGRNSLPSKCYLVSLGKSKNSSKRLQSIVDADNGFDVAMSDLSLRGEGSLFGTEQSGDSMMMFASLANHSEIIEEALEDAKKILNSEGADEAYSDALERYGRGEILK